MARILVVKHTTGKPIVEAICESVEDALTINVANLEATSKLTMFYQTVTEAEAEGEEDTVATTAIYQYVLTPLGEWFAITESAPDIVEESDESAPADGDGGEE